VLNEVQEEHKKRAPITGAPIKISADSYNHFAIWSASSFACSPATAAKFSLLSAKMIPREEFTNRPQ
jgi:hypothetical protein